MLCPERQARYRDAARALELFAALYAGGKDMAAMAGRFGIRFNCLAPNLIWTPKQDAVYKNEKTAAYFNGLIPLGHYGMPEDAAWLMVYLASDEAKYINGCCIPVDGGWHTCH